MLVSEQIGTRSRSHVMNIGETIASVESMAEDTVSIPPSHIHFTLDGNQSPLLPIKKRGVFHSSSSSPLVSIVSLYNRVLLMKS